MSERIEVAITFKRNLWWEGGRYSIKGVDYCSCKFFYNLINNTFLKELLQSEKVIQALKAHQKKVKENKIKEMQERKVKKEQEPLKEAIDQGKISACLIAGLLENAQSVQFHLVLLFF